MSHGLQEVLEALEIDGDSILVVGDNGGCSLSLPSFRPHELECRGISKMGLQ